MGVMAMGMLVLFFGGGAFLLYLALKEGISAAEPLTEGSRSSTSVSAFVSSRPKQKGMSMADARALQDEVLAVMETDDVSAQINAAARLMTAGLYEESIQAYHTIAEQYPGELGMCYGQIGAGYFFLGAYEQAISYYESAKAHGEDPFMMDENIAEALDRIAASSDVAEEDEDLGDDDEDFGDDE